ncbi:MAG: insulinase family protein [Eubacteriales bacterium]|nr:insulinase family protein [Eubacteriales bacterium]
MLYTQTMSNGLRMVCEPRPEAHSFSIAVWVKTGSCNEDPGNNGISHFTEHMLFKGTEKRSADQIAAEVDRVGGQINAFTGKEGTCFYIKVMDEDAELAVDVLSDIVLHSTFDQREIEKERGVILEEIAMVEDVPDELVQDLICSAVYGDHPLARTILGTKENVCSFRTKDFRQYTETYYVSGNMVVSVYGNFEREKLTDLVERYFCRDMRVGAESLSRCRPMERFVPGRACAEKDIEQLNVCLGFPGYAEETEQNLALAVLNNIVGGGMSSMLFQTIREQKGLAYSVYSYASSYSGAGTFHVYMGLSPENYPQAIGLTREILENLRGKIDDKRIADAAAQLKGTFVLSNERAGAAASAGAKSLLLHGRVITPDELLDRIRAVTPAQVRAAAAETLDFAAASIAVVGRGVKDVVF